MSEELLAVHRTEQVLTKNLHTPQCVPNTPGIDFPPSSCDFVFFFHFCFQVFAFVVECAHASTHFLDGTDEPPFGGASIGSVVETRSAIGGHPVGLQTRAMP